MSKHSEAYKALQTLIMYTWKRDCRQCAFCVGQKDSYYIDGYCIMYECPQMCPQRVQNLIANRVAELEQGEKQ